MLLSFLASIVKGFSNTPEISWRVLKFLLVFTAGAATAFFCGIGTILLLYIVYLL
jgi:hypothetical protein